MIQHASVPDKGGSDARRLPLLEYALRYRRHHGLSVIPIRPRTKAALTSWRQYQTRRMTDHELCRTFGRGKARTALAVVCGPISGGLAVRDWDSTEAYDHWSHEFPNWASRLPTVRTARGFHVYFRTGVLE